MEQPGQPESSNTGSARLRVLEMIDEGTITAEEGLRLLQAFSAADSAADAADQVDFLAESAKPSLDESEIPLPGGAAADAPPAAIEAAEFSASPAGPIQATDATPVIATPIVATPVAATPVAATPAASQAAAEPIPSTAPPGLPADAQKWQRWWMLPVWIGVAITVFGGLFMYLAMQSSGVGLWFVCASVPFILGLLVIMLAWGSRSAPWLHLRVEQPPGEKPQRIAFSMPLPIRPAVWFLRTFGRWIPSLKEQAWDDLILAVGDKTSPSNPLYIVVDEDETGEKVEIYIG